MRITDAVCVGVSRLAACPVDERANSDSSDDDVAHMRVTIFLTLDRAGRVKAEVQEVVKAGDHLEVDNTAKADALTACDTSGTEDRYRVDTSQMSTPFPIPGLHWHDPHSNFARKEKRISDKFMPQNPGKNTKW